MREPPAGLVEADVVDAVRRGWAAAVDRVRHLPVGFGAHHWAADDASGTPLLFVTYDRLEPKRSAARLEAAYDGAAALHAQGLEFVVAPELSGLGTRTIAFADGALSCLAWLDGLPSGDLDLAWTTQALTRLHATRPPPDLPPWRPVVAPDLADQLTELTAHPWETGPYGAAARDTVRDHLGDLARWTARYHALAEVARTRPWVATHGEPDQGNQLLTPVGRVLVDWESLRLAPAELDLRVLVAAGLSPAAAGADPAMLELFDLEWRLDEIAQYARWFAADHTGTDDDRIAFGGLRHELARP